MASPRWLAWMEGLYRAMLSLYPSAFRRRFAGEMTQVFTTLNRAEYLRAGSGGALRLELLAFADGLRAIIRQWCRHLVSRRFAMEEDRVDPRGGMQPLSPARTALAVLPFVLYGLAVILQEFWHPVITTFPPPIPEMFFKMPFLWFAFLCLVGLAVGLVKGFPRWAQPYLGWTLYFCWWWSNMTTYSFRWDARVWLAPLGVLLLALLIRRSLHPLIAILRALWQDWTLPSFVLFIFYCGFSILYDENHHSALLLFMATTTLAAAAGTWAYYRISSAIPRILALGGALVIIALLMIWCYGTWDYRAFYHLPPGPQFEWRTLWITLLVAGLMLLPALLARWRGKLSRKQPA